MDAESVTSKRRSETRTVDAALHTYEDEVNTPQSLADINLQPLGVGGQFGKLKSIVFVEREDDQNVQSPNHTSLIPKSHSNSPVDSQNPKS